MIVECPRCRVRVALSSDGICPSCRRNPNDLQGIETTLVGLTVGAETILPPVCYSCGRGADKTHRIIQKRKNPNASNDEAVVLSLIFGLLGTLIGFFERSGAQKFSVGLPVCTRCAKKKPKIDFVDWEHFQIRVACHRRLRDEMKSAQQD